VPPDRGPRAQPAGNARRATRPPRKRARRGKKARTLRALQRALATAGEIQGTSRMRQRRRSAGEANAAASLDTDLELLYEVLGDDKRGIFALGLVPNGSPYHGQTWRPR